MELVVVTIVSYISIWLQYDPIFWDSGDDVGVGTVGVIVELDPDAGFAYVEWPLDNLAQQVQQPSHGGPMCCRIGASNKFELQIGPVGLPDFYVGDRNRAQSSITGIIPAPDVSLFRMGQLIDSRSMVVGIRKEQNLLLVAPTQNYTLPSRRFTPPAPLPIEPMRPSGEPQPIPDHWQLDRGLFVELYNNAETGAMQERQDVLDLFFDIGGMDIQAHEIVSIKRVQSAALWQDYAATRDGIANENWGMANEHRLFHGTLTASPEKVLRDTPRDIYQQCRTENGEGLLGQHLAFHRTVFGTRLSLNRTRSGEIQVVVSKVALGRVMVNGRASQAPAHCNYHAKVDRTRRTRPGLSTSKVLLIHNPTQAYPDYIVTFREPASASPRRRVLRAARPDGASTPSPRARQRQVQQQQQQQRQQQQRDQVRQTMQRANMQAATNRGSTTTTAAPACSGNSTNTNSKMAPAAPTVASPPSAAGTSSSPTKECVICWERPVSHVMVPCGHPCLCGICATKQGLRKIGRKCPECRQHIQTTVLIYGRVVND